MVKKVAIIGAGFVGSTAAYSLFIDGTATEIALIDVNKEKAHGEALDLVHGNLFTPYTKVTYDSDYSLVKGADIVIITAGQHQKEGDTRLDLIKKNSKIMEDIVPNIVKHNKDCILLMVSNPLDVLTYTALKMSGFSKNKVFGTGTMLDTARFRQYLGEYYDVNPQSVHAFILGEHGDSEFPVWSSANIAGIRLKDFENYDKEKLDDIFQKTKNAAYEIVSKKGATYYAIGLAITKVVKSILNDQQEVLPVSHFIENYYGVKDVCLSIPAVVDKSGISKSINLHLNVKEQKQLKNSAKIMKKYIKKIGY